MGFVIGPIEQAEIQGIESMPAALAQLATMLGDPDAGAADFARVLELDPVMTADVLRMANSAWSRSNTEILTVRDAIMRIGAANVLKMGVGERVKGSMKEAASGYDLPMGELWRHSVAAALAAERMGAYTSDPIPGAAFTCALLHDVGKLPMSQRLGHQGLGEVQAIVDNEGLSHIEAERELLATDHAEAGATIVRRWGLPETLAEAVGNHHDPDREPDPVGDAVHVANLVAKFICVGLGIGGMAVNMSDGAAHRLGLTTRNLEALCADVDHGLSGAMEIFGG